MARVKNGHGTEWMNLAEFLHANTYLRKLQVTLIVIGLAWSIMGVSFQVTGLYNLLYVSQEWMNELSWFFACSCMVSGKLKLTLGMQMAKYDCDLLDPGPLKSALSQLKNQSMNWADFLHGGSDGIIFS